MTKPATTSKPTDPSYQFQVGDLIEYHHPEGGIYKGRIVGEYCLRRCLDNNRTVTHISYGYGLSLDGAAPADAVGGYFAFADGLRLRPDLAAAREDNAFQVFLHTIVTAPRRGRRPKSPYPAQDRTAEKPSGERT
ncbi:MAG: hypothetical protein LBU72_04495 [Burkholderiaceae bacterium]|jgi:hypothetical protein|nr:hypothetical protein [Burkholderiaceae bacterium]